MTHLETIAARLDEFLDERDLEAVWFGESNSFAWITGGSNVVARGSHPGVAAIGYDGEEFTAVTNNIEAQRLVDEELPDGIGVEQVDWYTGGLGHAVAEVSPSPAAADFDVPGMESVDPTPLRQPLTDRDIEGYRSLGEDAAEVLEAVLREASSSDTEREVGAELRKRLFERGIDSPVVLVGSGDRVQRYRHFTTRDNELGEYVVASITAVRQGLCASTSRTVAFDAPDWLIERTEKAMQVEATALAATREVGREGGTASEVFEAIQQAYADVGYSGEWELHHQGGAAGYAGREWKATHSSDDRVFLPMGYAYNPTVQGAKSEDTALVTEDDVEVLTATGDWPTTEVEAAGHDLSLERHAVLER